MDRASNCSEPAARGQGPCILVVDDSSTMRRSVAMTLEAVGYQVVTACDGLDALAALQRGVAPRLVLTDIVMPGMDGLEFIREARKLLRFVPIVALTTQTHQHLREQGRAVGATAWVLKPTGGQELVALAAKFLTRAASDASPASTRASAHALPKTG